nr:alanine and glycine-rich protein-like [Aegilops tauschii subsp. strangulata]
MSLDQSPKTQGRGGGIRDAHIDAKLRHGGRPRARRQRATGETVATAAHGARGGGYSTRVAWERKEEGAGAVLEREGVGVGVGGGIGVGAEVESGGGGGVGGAASAVAWDLSEKRGSTSARRE